MHTFIHEGTGVVFNHNGDFTGEVRISGAIVIRDEEPVGPYVTVEFDALKALVAEYVRTETISVLEMAEPDDLLFREVRR